jgi:hypothetical protein
VYGVVDRIGCTVSTLRTRAATVVFSRPKAWRVEQALGEKRASLAANDFSRYSLTLFP